MKQQFSGRDYGSLPWGNPLSSPYWRLAFLPPELWDAPKRETAYILSFLPLAGGSTGVSSFSVKGRGPFIIYGVSAFANNPGATPPVLRWGSGLTQNQMSRLLCQITDTKNLYDLFSQPAPLDNFASAAPNLSAGWVPYVCDPGTSISLVIQNQNVPGAGEDWNWWITFWGAEVLST